MLVLRSETKQVHVRTQRYYLVILLPVSACRIDGETVNLAREFYFFFWLRSVTFAALRDVNAVSV